MCYGMSNLLLFTRLHRIEAVDHFIHSNRHYDLILILMEAYNSFLQNHLYKFRLHQRIYIEKSFYKILYIVKPITCIK